MEPLLDQTYNFIISHPLHLIYNFSTKFHK